MVAGFGVLGRGIGNVGNYLEEARERSVRRHRRALERQTRRPGATGSFQLSPQEELLQSQLNSTPATQGFRRDPTVGPEEQVTPKTRSFVKGVFEDLLPSVLAGAVDTTLFGGVPVTNAGMQAIKGDKKGAATTLATGGAKKAVDAGVKALEGAKVVKKAADSVEASMPGKTAEQVVSERIATAPNVSEEVRRQLAEDRFELSAKQRRELLKDLSPAEVKEELAFKKASTLMQSPDLTRQMIRRGALGEGTKRNLAAFGRSALDEFDKMGAGDVESSTMLLDSGFGKGRVSPFTGRITYGDPEARAFYQELAALDSGPAAVDPVVERLGGGPAIGISEDVMAQAVSPGRIEMPSPVFIPEPSLDAPTMEQFNAQELARQQLAEDRQSQAVLGQMQKLAEQATQAESRLMGQGGGAAPVSTGIGEYDSVYGQQLAASNPNDVQGNMLSQAANVSQGQMRPAEGALRSGRFGEERGMPMQSSMVVPGQVTTNIDVRPPLMDLSKMAGPRPQPQVNELPPLHLTEDVFSSEPYAPRPERMLPAMTPEQLQAYRQQQQVIPLEGMTVTASPPAQVNQLSPLNLTEDVFSSEPYGPPNLTRLNPPLDLTGPVPPGETRLGPPLDLTQPIPGQMQPQPISSSDPLYDFPSNIMATLTGLGYVPGTPEFDQAFVTLLNNPQSGLIALQGR
tara:strand:- start:10551 stop:12599 length:2049 start_codon:yes stop_codon:yes gene_type:complete